MEITAKKPTRKQWISSLVEILEKEQPDALERSLEQLYLLTKAQALDKNVGENEITMDEITEEVTIVRKKRYAEKQNRI
jgi:hypothetical protein